MIKKAYFNHITALLLFGLNGIVASLIDLKSSEIVFFRTLAGSLFLAFVFVLKKEKPTFHKHKKQLASLVLSGMAMGASWLFLYEAYNRLGVGLASLMYYCGPVLVMLMSPLLFGEKLTKDKIISFSVVLAGIFLLNGASADGSKNTVGIVCALLSALCYAAMVIFNKKAKSITGLENSVLQLFAGFITVAAFVLPRCGGHIAIAPTSIAPMLALGVINTGVGCYLYFSSIGKLPVQTVAVCGYTEPLAAVVFSAVFLKEVMSPVQITGAALIICGAIYGEIKKPIR